MSAVSLVVTSIAAPNRILNELARGARDRDIPFYVIGDVPSPDNFAIDGCDFYSIAAQQRLDFETARQTPLRHYARKNIGYLLAIQSGTRAIIETDDDNLPTERFWDARRETLDVDSIENAGWVNVYRYFSDALIWPRGFPLELLQSIDGAPAISRKRVRCPIQQGLADNNPDVDAVYRLVLPLPQNFRDYRLALTAGSWCPFNSQNTTFFEDAFELLYLPAFCSFRMTDIWRSFVAQRILWANGWGVLFHEPTVVQERNDHNLLKDFSQETEGYLNNARIAEELSGLSLPAGADRIADNLLSSYEALVRLGVFPEKELNLLGVWLQDVRAVRPRALSAAQTA